MKTVSDGQPNSIESEYIKQKNSLYSTHYMKHSSSRKTRPLPVDNGEQRMNYSMSVEVPKHGHRLVVKNDSDGGDLGRITVS